MVRWFREFIKLVVKFFTEKPYKVQYFEERPNQLVKNVLYVLGEKDNPWSVILLCPCGCRDSIQLSLLPIERPFWKIEIFKDKKVSITPSIWRQLGCKSHFFITQNKVKWCK